MLATLVFFALPVSLFDFMPGLLLDLLEDFRLFFWMLMTRYAPFKNSCYAGTLPQCIANAKRLLCCTTVALIRKQYGCCGRFHTSVDKVSSILTLWLKFNPLRLKI